MYNSELLVNTYYLQISWHTIRHIIHLGKWDPKMKSSFPGNNFSCATSNMKHEPTDL